MASVILTRENPNHSGLSIYADDYPEAFFEIMARERFMIFGPIGHRERHGVIYGPKEAPMVAVGCQDLELSAALEEAITHDGYGLEAVEAIAEAAREYGYTGKLLEALAEGDAEPEKHRTGMAILSPGMYCPGEEDEHHEDGLVFRFRFIFDGENERPDAEEGFWPSLNPCSPGFIGKDSTVEDWLKNATRARKVIDAWQNDEWFYCTLVVDVFKETEGERGELLEEWAASLGRLECNHPMDPENHYICVSVARELIDEAKYNVKAGASSGSTG